MRRVVIPLCAVLGALRAVSLTAQAVDSAGGPTAPWVCSAVKPGMLVRVSARPALRDRTVGALLEGPTGRGSQVGPVIRCDDREIVLGPSISQEAPEYIVPRLVVQRVWVRRAAGREGLALGALFGAAAGGALAAVKSNICPGTGPCRSNVPVGIAAGALVGGVIGWVLGQGLPHWKRVYP
jgi:hypothetical protein